MPTALRGDTIMQNNNSRIVNSWSFLAFCREVGAKRLKYPEFTDKNTGEVFHSVAAVDGMSIKALIGFSSRLGELSPKEIADRKDGLQVVQLESGSYKLCKKGELPEWEDIDIEL